MAVFPFEVAFELLASRHDSWPGPSGVIPVTKNRKLQGRLPVVAFHRLGWQRLGREAQVREWFGRRFDGTSYDGRLLPDVARCGES